MRNGTNGAAGDRLREAERQQELWRLRCRRPGRIPAELWLLAAEAVAEQGSAWLPRQPKRDATRTPRRDAWIDRQPRPTSGRDRPTGRRVPTSAAIWKPSARPRPVAGQAQASPRL